MIRMIATDVDGTFCNSQSTYNRERFSAQIEKLKELGINFVIASGNQQPAMYRKFAPYSEDMHFVCLNGCTIGKANTILHSSSMDPFNARKTKDFKIINIHNTSYSNIPTDKKNNKNIYFNGKSLISFDNLKYKEYIEKKNVSELVIYEKDINSTKPNYINVYIYPVTEIEKETVFLTIKKTHKILSYPVLITINKNYSLEDLNALIFSKLRKALMSQFQNQHDSINLYFPHFDSSWERYKAKEKKCPICQKSYSKEVFCCSLFDSMDKTCKISDLLEKQGAGRPLILFAKSDIYDRKNEIYNGMDLFFDKNNEIETKEVISLYDCLDCLNIPKITEFGNKLYSSFE